ncbi:hypothetical protein AB0G49_30735 [Streptomyces longwoodensis]|uniref:hypothetical protein n=1 Tax=Streptomyces longwoodensis TaxID=68231 RepID=UPI0033EB934B
MIIPRRPTHHWIRLVAVDDDERVLLVREDAGEEHPAPAPGWRLPGVRRDPAVPAEAAARALLARLALPATEPPRRLRERTLSSIVAGEVARQEEVFFTVRPHGPGSPGEGVYWYPLRDVRDAAGPPLAPHVADLLRNIRTAPLT